MPGRNSAVRIFWVPNFEIRPRVGTKLEISPLKGTKSRDFARISSRRGTKPPILPTLRLGSVPNLRSWLCCDLFRQRHPSSRYQTCDFVALCSPALAFRLGLAAGLAVLVPCLCSESRHWLFHRPPRPRVVRSRAWRCPKSCTRKRRGCLRARAIVAAARFISSMEARWFRVMLMTR